MDLRTRSPLRSSGVETLGCCVFLTQLEFLMFDDLGDILAQYETNPHKLFACA